VTLGASILIVDDDADIAESLREVLAASGYAVRTASGGRAGLRSLVAYALPHCVILDIDMPWMSGPQMAHQMLVHDAGQEKIPIILLSGHPDIAAIARDVGTTYFLRKPVELVELRSMVEKAVQEKLAPVPPGGREGNG
jgi:FixJ family two-component response regulator